MMMTVYIDGLMHLWNMFGVAQGKSDTRSSPSASFKHPIPSPHHFITRDSTEPHKPKYIRNTGRSTLYIHRYSSSNESHGEPDHESCHSRNRCLQVLRMIYITSWLFVPCSDSTTQLPALARLESRRNVPGQSKLHRNQKHG